MRVIDGKEVFTTVDELVNPKHTALLLIDLQNDFMTHEGYADKRGTNLSDVRQIISRVKQVLEAARLKNILVVHIQMTHYPGFLDESPVAFGSC